MYSLLIVEDNKRDARIIQETVSFHALGISVTGVATDGEEAVEMALSLKPDIILSDICMPVMNGIEMARIMTKERPETKILFISSYDDFQFAKSAIDLNISGYILKPINWNEIEDALRKVTALCDDEKKKTLENERLLAQLEESIPLLREEFFREMMLWGGFTEERAIRERMCFLQCGVADFKTMAIAVMSIKAPEPDCPASDGYLFNLVLLNQLHELSQDCIVHAVRVSHFTYALGLFFNEADPLISMNLALEYVMSVYEILIDRLGIAAILGLSDISDKAISAPLLYRQAEQAAGTTFYSNGNPVILYNEIAEPEGATEKEGFGLNDLERDLDESVFLGDEDEMDRFIDKYLNARPSGDTELYRKSLAYSIVNILQIMLAQKGLRFQNIVVDEKLLWEKLFAFETILDLRQWLKNILLAVKKNIEESQRNRYASMVQAIKDAVATRYMDALNVTDIAKAVYLSPKHANAVFRKMTGYTIFDYLMNFRMEKAKKLLKESDEKIHAVAECVGYANKSHFALMFKKYTGMTPAEYKNKSVR